MAVSDSPYEDADEEPLKREELERALQQFAVTVEAKERDREHARSEEDFASIRDDPQFPA